MDDQDVGRTEDEIRRVPAKRELPTTEELKPGFYRAIEEIRDRDKG
jgi:hypothetical protein